MNSLKGVGVTRRSLFAILSVGGVTAVASRGTLIAWLQTVDKGLLLSGWVACGALLQSSGVAPKMAGNCHTFLLFKRRLPKMHRIGKRTAHSR